jgi:AcrR family transcriptional regulator
MARASTKSAVTRPGRVAQCPDAPRPIPRGRPPDEALQERRRAEILDQAAVVFAKHGYPNTDVQFIADPLDISKGTVYRYFPSKERLFLAAVERGVRQLKAHIDRAVEGITDPLRRIAAGTRAHLEFFKTRPALVELFVLERAEFRDRRKPVYFELGEACEAPWRELVEGLIAAGRVRPMPVERVMNVVGDLIYGTVFTNHFAGRQKPPGEQAADILDVVFNGILSERERKQRPAVGPGPEAMPAK